MSQYLLDTHVAYWLLVDDRENLPADIRDDIECFRNRYYVSAASLLELGIKQQKGQIELDGSPRQIQEYLLQWDISVIDVSVDVIDTFYKMGIPESQALQHKDPFDRLIIATALNYGFTLVSADRKFPWWQRYRKLSLLYIE